MTTDKGSRYLELCDLARCSPDSANIHNPGDATGAAQWLSKRLARYGHEITPGQCREAADDFWDWMHDTPAAPRWTIRL